MTLSSEELVALKELSRRSDLKGLAQLALHLLLLAASSLMVFLAGNTPWLLPALLAQGILMVFLFCAEHECVHRTAFLSRRLNDAVAWLCGLVICLPPVYFRTFHLAHHRHTQDPERDPELATPKPSNLGGYLWHLSGLPFTWERCTTTLRHALFGAEATFLPARDQPAATLEARIYLAIYAAVAGLSLWFLSDAALRYWLLPALLGQPFLRAYLLAEHHGCPETPDMMLGSRTTRSNWMVRRLAWNMPYHGAHHAQPAVPFHALATADRVLGRRPRTVSPGYLAFHREVVTGLRTRQ